MSMNIEIVNTEKDDIELKIDNPTIAEVMRVYLNDAGVKFAAWRREHPSKPVIMRIQLSSGTVKKAVADVVAAIHKDISAIESAVKKK